MSNRVPLISLAADAAMHRDLQPHSSAANLLNNSSAHPLTHLSGCQPGSHSICAIHRRVALLLLLLLPAQRRHG